MKKRNFKRIVLVTGSALLGLAALWLFLQFVWPHRTQPFHPNYAQVDLTPILEKDALSREDYETLYAQTGLSPTAVDDLRAMGRTRQILETQAAFFQDVYDAPCAPLGITTREHRLRQENGTLVYNSPLAPLKEGDVLVSFSTHTAGWNHGHAGLVIDPQSGVTLESVVLGSLSSQNYVAHWRTYSTLVVLRPKADDATRHAVADLALEYLDQVPYSLTCGIFGDKFQPLEGSHSAHCSYLPWYAWQAVGYDLDGDGGRIVTPRDLSLSDKVEVIQVYGVDPAQFPLAFDD